MMMISRFMMTIITIAMTHVTVTKYNYHGCIFLPTTQNVFET